MNTNLAAVLCLAFVINLIGGLAYAGRIAGLRTGRIAMSFALFNVLLLVSRLSNGFLAPLVAKRVENSLAEQTGANLEMDFWLILLAAIFWRLGRVDLGFNSPTLVCACEYCELPFPSHRRNRSEK